VTNERSQRNGSLERLAVVALVVTFLLRYAPFIASRLLFAPLLDNVYIYGPIFSEVSRLSLAGAVPYYLPSIGTGFPVFESPHFSILYPFYFFGLLNYGGPLASLYTLTNLTLLHVFIFYVNLYVLLRCATITPWASYIGASVGMLAPNTVLYSRWITITASYAWLPLVLAGAVLLFRFPGKARGILVFSIAAGLLALASASQSVIHAALACLILFAAGVIWMCLERRFTDIWRLACSLVVCTSIAFGLAGAAILPMYIATGEMIRFIAPNAWVIGHAHIPWEVFNLWQLPLSQTIGIVMKPTWIATLGRPYVGPLGVIGTLLAAVHFRRLNAFLRMLVVAFGAISMYGLLSAFGTNFGFAYVNFHLPFINLIREAARHLVLFVIGVSFLSGVGYSLAAQAIEQYKDGRNARPLILSAMLMLIFVGIIVRELLNRPVGTRIETGGFQTGFWILASTPILVVLGLIFNVSHYYHVTFAALLVSLAGMVIPLEGFSVSESSIFHQTGFNTPMNLLSHRVIKSFADKIDIVGYRVDFRDKRFPDRFWAMNASYYGIKSFYNQLNQPAPYGQFRFGELRNISHLRAMMGARYVLCGPNMTPIDRDAKQILESEGYRLYENPNPMGRLTLVHRVAGFVSSEGEFIKTISRGFDYLSEAYVNRKRFEKARRFLDNSQMSLHAQDRIVKTVDQPNRSYSAVESDSASLLILNEWFTPAWKARVNGKKQAVLRVNEWQSGVLLPAGKNRVEFEYSPTLFRVLMILNRITVALLLAFMIFCVVRKRWLCTIPGFVAHRWQHKDAWVQP
jgi:Bacterial membrane protein YfhO